MKKLILVTMMAVGASWLIYEAQPTGFSPQPVLTTKTEIKKALVRDELGDVPPPRAEEPGSIRTIPWRTTSRKDDSRARKAPAGKPVLPSWFPKTEAEEEARAKPDADGWRVLLGQIAADEDRARKDLRKLVENEVTTWIAGDVPPSWKVPDAVIDDMLRDDVLRRPFVQELVKDLTSSPAAKPEDPAVDGFYTLYRAGQRINFSADRRAEIVGMYRRDLAATRMQRLGGGLALALVGLAVLSGYIKADEATKGYYTNRLRLAAAAGLGAAGVAAYRYLV
jgi:hypothetical protein